jgi:hypothetical protein
MADVDPLSLVNPKYLVKLSGKLHPTYPGVLEAAMKAGLIGLEAKVEQFPSAENGNLAVCSAVATFAGTDGRDRVFAEVGDCDDGNCGPLIARHKVRMAATRAKGRALRDALGIGVALKEEIDGTDTDAVHDVGNRQTRGIQPNQSVKPPADPQRGNTRPRPSPNPAPAPAASAVAQPETPEEVVCEVCEQPLTHKAVTACMDHPELFDGKYLCAEHRKDYRDRVELGARAKVPSGILA